MDGVEIQTVNYSGHTFGDFFVRTSPHDGRGWYVFGRNSEKYGVGRDGRGAYVMLCARPDVAPRRTAGYNGATRRGWSTRREAQAIVDQLNAAA